MAYRGRAIAYASALWAAAVAPLVAQAAPGAAPKGVEEPRARGFQRILWMHGGPAPSAELFAAVRQLGFDAVQVSGGAPTQLPGQYGLRYYHDQLCGKGVLELRAAQYEPLVAAYSRDRNAAVLQRPNCLSSLDTLTGLIETARVRLDTTLPTHPLAISLGDEISITRHANPLDLCVAPDSLRGFRKFLEARYGTVERLNQAWGTDFDVFARVLPFSADAIRQRELGGARLPRNLAPWAAHREFMDGELARVVWCLTEQVKRRAGGLPCGLTGLQQPSAYGGHDFARLLPNLTLFEAYDHGAARDLAMCLAPPEALQLATLFAPKSGEPPQLVLARLADMVAHGIWGVVVWSSGEVFRADRRPSTFGGAVAKAFRELARPAAAFAGARLRRGPVWIVESQPSVRAWWMLDSRRDGATWIKRLSSHEREHSTSMAARYGWVRLIEDLGQQARLVAVDRLAAELRREPPRVLVLAATIALSDAAAAAIRRYVAAGGVLVADHTPGLYDDRLRLRDQPVLDSLFGVAGRSLDLDALRFDQGRPFDDARLASGAAAAERGLSAALSEPASGFHVQMERSHGRGKTVYLNLSVAEYGHVRLDPRRVAVALDLRRRVRHVLRQAGVQPPVVLRAEGMPTCLERIVLKARDGRDLLAIRVNALESPAILAELGKRSPAKLTAVFPTRVALVDQVTGTVLAPAARHELRFDPWRGLFLEVRRE